MSIFTAEVIGTAILVLLGDGVVAAVLLARSKAHKAGWIVIAFGWGLAVAMAVYAVGPLQRRTHQPRRHLRAGLDRHHRLERCPPST